MIDEVQIFSGPLPDGNVNFDINEISKLGMMFEIVVRNRGQFAWRLGHWLLGWDYSEYQKIMDNISTSLLKPDGERRG